MKTKPLSPQTPSAGRRLRLGTYLPYLIVIVLFAWMAVLVETGAASRQLQGLLVPIGLNIILAVSLNLVVGFLGELSLGHAGFMSVGAYAGCILSIHLQDTLPTAVRFPLVILFGGIVAAVFGLIIGTSVMRLRGDYLAIVTLAFGEIIRSVANNLSITGGALGLNKIPADTTYIITFVVLLITLVVVINLVNSRHGRAIRAIRDNDIAAKSIGIHVTYYKLLAFTVAAFFAGVAGVLYGHSLTTLTASTFDYNRSIEILVIVVLGGMGSITGSIISAIVITYLPQLLRELATVTVFGEPLLIFGKRPEDYRMLIYAVALIAMMLLNASPKFAAFKQRIRPRKLIGRLRRSVKEG